jgi:protein TonB
MAEGPDPGRSREALEELVYRPALGGGAVRGASPWLTVPVTLALAGALAGLALLAGRRTEDGREPVSVSVVLQEAPDAPARAAAAAPAAPRAPAPPAPAAPAAPAPLVQPPAPAASAETAPDTPPRDLPREDHSRQAGGALSAAPGGAGAGPGAQAGTGAAGPGGPAAKVLDLESTQVKIKFRPPPPDYPALARRAGVQGTVVVQILVGPDGVPVSARALEGPFMLRAAAEAYALAWRFHPPLVNGVPQASRFTLTMPFTLK